MRRWKAVLLGLFFALAPFIAQGAEMGKFQYEDFKNPERCRTCHKEIYKVNTATLDIEVIK